MGSKFFIYYFFRLFRLLKKRIFERLLRKFGFHAEYSADYSFYYFLRKPCRFYRLSQYSFFMPNIRFSCLLFFFFFEVFGPDLFQTIKFRLNSSPCNIFGHYTICFYLYRLDDVLRGSVKVQKKTFSYNQKKTFIKYL